MKKTMLLSVLAITIFTFKAFAIENVQDWSQYNSYCNNIVGGVIIGYDSLSGKYIKPIGAILNPYNTYSIANDYGWGSEYRTNSVNNTYGTYGSEYSSYSASNSYANYPPRIYVSNGYYNLTNNSYKTGAIPLDFAIYCANETYSSSLSNYWTKYFTKYGN